MRVRDVRGAFSNKRSLNAVVDLADSLVRDFSLSGIEVFNLERA